MADATYQDGVYRKQGGNELVVGAGGIISNDGTQASTIADIATDASGTEISVAVNAILAALEGVGITASA